MTRIRCKYIDCAFLDENYCSAALIELNSDKGCLTYSPVEETQVEDEWDVAEDLDSWEELEEEDEKDDDLWIDDEEEEEL